MSQNYTPTEWIGNRTVGTASVMNNMENGIKNAHNRIDSFDSQIKDITNELGKNENGTDIELSTTDKTIKGAINELKKLIGNISIEGSTIYIGPETPTNGALYWLDTSVNTSGGNTGEDSGGNTGGSDFIYDVNKWIAGQRFNGTGSLGLYESTNSSYYDEYISILGKTTLTLTCTSSAWGFLDFNLYDDSKTEKATKQCTIEGTAGASIDLTKYSTYSYIRISVTSTNNRYDNSVFGIEVV